MMRLADVIRTVTPGTFHSKFWQAAAERMDAINRQLTRARRSDPTAPMLRVDSQGSFEQQASRFEGNGDIFNLRRDILRALDMIAEWRQGMQKTAALDHVSMQERMADWERSTNVPMAVAEVIDEVAEWLEARVVQTPLSARRAR